MLIVWSGWWWLRKTWVTSSGATPRAGQRVEDERAPGDHARVDHDQRVAVADEHDAAADAVVGVAGVEEVDAGHGAMLPRAAAWTHDDANSAADDGGAPGAGAMLLVRHGTHPRQRKGEIQ